MEIFILFVGAGSSIKQSGAVLLGYPLMWNLTSSALENNLRVYTEVVPEATSSTAWSMLAINWLAVGQEQKGHELFEKSYKSYVSEPFKVSTVCRDCVFGCF